MLCLDELGPLGCSVYPTKSPYPCHQHPRFTPDYGGRDKCWTFGSLVVATGQASTMTSLRRFTADFMRFLDQILSVWTQGQLGFVLDNLSVRRTQDVQLWAIAHPRVRFLFQPTYSPWLNLIEPWWKTLRSLALKGTAFDSLDRLRLAISNATSHWKLHKHPFRQR